MDGDKMSDLISNSLSGLNYTNSTTYNSKTSSLENTLNNSDLSNADTDKLMSVCKDFESYFVEQMLKSMEKMAKIDSDDDSSTSLFNSMASIGGESDSAMSTLGSYFGDEMIKNYAELFTESDNGKGLGIAQTLYQQMKRNYTVDEA